MVVVGASEKLPLALYCMRRSVGESTVKRARPEGESTTEAGSGKGLGAAAAKVKPNRSVSANNMGARAEAEDFTAQQFFSHSKTKGGGERGESLREERGGNKKLE